MTEQLHDLLTRIADQAGPGSSDPTVWDRARRARRRERMLRASAAVVCAVGLLGALAFGVSSRNAAPPTHRQSPAPHETGEGIPSTVRGIRGDGGLELETDLAVGPASVAIANSSGAYVVTAADGVYHRLRLPGFDPAAFDEVRPGLAVSPDGTRLAYGWRAASPAPGSKSRSRIGTRVLDLRTGRLQKIPGLPGYFADSTRAVDNFGYGWSPNGRFLIFETLTNDPADSSLAHWWSGFDTSKARFFMFGHEARDLSCAEATDCPPMTLVRPSVSARVKSLQEFTGSSEKALLITSQQYNITRLPTTGDWAVGRFSPDGRRLLLQPDSVGIGLVLVAEQDGRRNRWRGEGQVTLLSLDSADWPDGARIDVLGWVGPDHALAIVNRGTGPDAWERRGQLVLVDLRAAIDSAAAASPLVLDVVGQVEAGDPGTAYSLATGFASVDTPTRSVDRSGTPHQIDPSPIGARRSQDDQGGQTTRLASYTAAGLTLVAGLALVLARRRRKRTLQPQ